MCIRDSYSVSLTLVDPLIREQNAKLRPLRPTNLPTVLKGAKSIAVSINCDRCNSSMVNIREKRVRTSRINGSDEQGLPSRPNEIFKTKIPCLQLLISSQALGINIHCFFCILDYRATRFNIEYQENNNSL